MYSFATMVTGRRGDLYSAKRMTFGGSGYIYHYLPILQQRAKCVTLERNLRKDDLVLIMDSNLKTIRGYWPKGVVEETYPDKNGVVRTAKIWNGQHSYIRDIRKLCLLEGTPL